MKTWSFYDPGTGLFIKRTWSGPSSDLDANTPSGSAFIEGAHDHLSQRVDLDTGKVIDYQPPQPDSDHEWLENQFGDRPRWVKKPEVSAKERAAESAQKEIEALERAQLRSVRELLIDADNQEAKARLVEIDTQISEQRAVIQAATDKTPETGTGSAAALERP